MMSEYNVAGSADAIDRIVEQFGLEVTDRFPPMYAGSADWNVEVPAEIVDAFTDVCDGFEVAFALV